MSDEILQKGSINLKSKKRVVLVIGLVLLACIVTFVTILGLKEYSIYKEYSKIEEIHVSDPIENPNDYGLKYDNILFTCYSYSYYVENYYWIFFLNDGSVVTGKGDRDQQSVFWDGLHYKDEVLFWSSLDFTYKGNIGGKRLYNLLNLEEKIDYGAEYYSTQEEYEKLLDMRDDEEWPRSKDNWGSRRMELSPYLNFWKLGEKGGALSIWEEESDGIIYYLYDKNAEKLVYSTIDSSFFDEWMSESWGEDWKETFPIYRSKDDFVVPKW